MEACYATQSKFVVDNTNPSKAEREVIITMAKERHYQIVGYFFDTPVRDALARNEVRTGKDKIPLPGILGCYKKLELPQFAEGFDILYKVKIVDNKFIIEDWEDEI